MKTWTKAVTIGCTVFVGIILYTMMGAITYQLHEEMFPGTKCGHCANGSDLVAVMWPIGLPITLGIELAPSTEELRHVRD